MPMFSSSEVARLDNSNPELERAGAFARMAYSPVIITYQISDDATGNPTAFTAPFAMRVVDIIVEGQATAGGATVAFAKNSTTMCTAIACEADGTVSRLAAGAVAAAMLLAKGDVVHVDASASGVRGLITFIGYKV